jgi:hypothetical protein
MRKTFKIITLAVISCLVAVACNSNSNEKQIKETAKNYLHSINIECDFAKAKQFASPETQELLVLLDQIFSQSSQSSGAIDLEFKERYKNNSIDILDIEYESDSTAVVKYKISIFDENGNLDTEALGEDSGEGTLNMKKIDSKWYAHQPKEAPEDDFTFGEESEEELIEEEISTEDVKEDTTKETEEK